MKYTEYKIKEHAKSTVRKVATASLIYLGSLILLEGTSDAFSEKIDSQERLEGVCQEEIQKFGGAGRKKIMPILSTNENSKTCSRKVSEDEYHVIVTPEFSNRDSVKHELYHILDGHLDEEKSLSRKIGRKIGGSYLDWKYWLNYEPSAALYAAFGIKL